jgi:hypothetical protein
LILNLIILSDNEFVNTKSKTNYSNLNINLKAKSNSSLLYLNSKPANSNSFGLRIIYTSSCLIANYLKDNNKSNNNIINNTYL